MLKSILISHRIPLALTHSVAINRGFYGRSCTQLLSTYVAANRANFNGVTKIIPPPKILNHRCAGLVPVSVGLNVKGGSHDQQGESYMFQRKKLMFKTSAV